MMAITLGDLHQRCIDDKQTTLPQVVALAHFDLINHAFGEGWHDIEANSSGIEETFPRQCRETDCRVTSFGGPRLFQNCRSAMVKLVTECTEEHPEDPFRALRILGRAANLGSRLSDLKTPLTKAFGKDVDPAEISRDQAIRVDAALVGMDRQRFRRSIATLDRLRALPSVRARNLLPPDQIGVLPEFSRSGRRIRKFPPQLDEFCRQLKPAIKTAFKVTYALAVDDGLFKEGQDISPTEFVNTRINKRLADLLVAEYAGRTGQIYFNRVSKAVRDFSPDSQAR